MVTEEWRRLAAAQHGLVTRGQLRALGVDRWAVRHRLATQRWVAHTPTVIGTTTGELSREQLRWLGVLHGGPEAVVGDLSAAEVAGLRSWHRDDVTVLVPHGTSVGAGHPGVVFCGLVGRWRTGAVPAVACPCVGSNPRCCASPRSSGVRGSRRGCLPRWSSSS